MTPHPPGHPVVVLDASVWVSSLLPTDSNHAIANNWIEQHSRGGGIFVAPSLLVVEVAASVHRITNRPRLAHQAASQLYLLPTMRIAAIDQNLVNEASAVAADRGVRGADAVYVALAKIRGIPLLTFDKEQITRTNGLITAVHP